MTSDIENIYALSPMQQGMLFHTKYVPKPGVYFEQTVYTLQGDLIVSMLEQAWQRVIDRHPILRTFFLWKRRAEPLQVVRQSVKLPFIQQDWREVSLNEQQQRLDNFLREDRERGFDLSRAPLMRLALFRVNEDAYYFLWSYHHLLLDRWSKSLVFKEVFTYYKALSQDQDLHLEPTRPYSDFIAWLRRQDLSQAELYWRQALKGFSTPTDLGIGQPPGHLPNQKDTSEKQQIRLSMSTTAALQSLARRHRLTLNTLMQGAWALLLSRYSGEKDILFGATVSGRPADMVDVESIVGLFINTLPVRVQVSPEEALLPWLKRLQNQMFELRQYEYSPLVEVQGWSEISGNQPLFESILVFQNTPVDIPSSELGGDLEIRSIFSEGSRTDYPLVVAILPASELLIGIKSEHGRFDPPTITRMLGHFQTLLEGFITKPEAPISQLPLMTEAERHQLLEEWNDTRTDYPPDQCIHELFEAQVKRMPDQVAVVFREKKLTYRELNQRANQLAHHLKRLGVGRETPVGIYVERSLEMVVGLLGILKAGGAYIPLDPIYPRERLAFMLEDARVSVLLTEDRLAAALPEHKAELVCLDTDWIKITREGTKNPVNRVTSDDIAYVLYTSGSTGKPKGVVIPHRAICNHMLWMQKEFGFDQTDRILQKTPFSFDASVWEFYGPLLAGGQLIMAQSDGHRDGNYLVETIIDQKITTLQLVPSQLQMLLDIGGLENCHSLQRVFCGGEALSVELVNRLVTALPTADLINLYGPTEATIDTTCWTYQNQPNLVTVPIGRPIANAQVYILDPDLNPVPIGVRGELYIGGAGVGRGYLNRPVLTTQKFIQDPFSDEPSVRLYKTGDIARYLPDGNIEFLGRIDDQTKLRGYRIELGEIEVGLSRHPSVSEAIVVVREDTPGDRRLVAYIKPTEGAVPTSQELRQALSQKLPEYMIPLTYIILDAWPLTPSGKIARQALPAPEQARPGLERVFVTPQDLLELQLTEIWEEVLDVQPVGIRDNFFELGGHSLLAVRLFAQIEEILDRNLPVGLIFQAPTVEQQAGMLRREGWSPPQTSLVPIRTGGPKRPLFFVPPAGNTVVGFADLIRNLGPDQPCYGLQPPTPNGRQTPFNRVEDLAAHFIKEIRTIQPEGPYLLGGQCFGGQVVFEMAQQFRTEGQATALLALFDTPYPNPTLSSKISWHLEVLGKLESKEKLDYLLVKVKRRLAKMISRVYLKTGRPLPAQVQDLAAEAGIRQASNSYQPQRYQGQITLFRAGGEGFGEGSQDLERGWGHVAAAGVEVHLVPGTHREMMSEPHVQVLAEQLRVCLDQAQAADVDLRNDSI